MADPDTRVYGMADSSNHQDAAENGMRGEAASDAAGPGYRHEVRPPDQPAIVVEETSGVAVAEGMRRQPVKVTTQEAQTGSTLPWVLVALVLGFAAGRLRRDPEPTPERHPTIPVALTRMPGEVGGFSQVRNAGPAEIRDPQERWSAIDEASDESFPASDSPAISPPGR